MIKILKEFDVERKKIYKETDINYLQENNVDAFWIEIIQKKQKIF